MSTIKKFAKSTKFATKSTKKFDEDQSFAAVADINHNRFAVRVVGKSELHGSTLVGKFATESAAERFSEIKALELSRKSRLSHDERFLLADVHVVVVDTTRNVDKGGEVLSFTTPYAEADKECRTAELPTHMNHPMPYPNVDESRSIPVDFLDAEEE
jgi:hypothetical protein